VADAGQVRHRADLRFALDSFDELDGLLPRRSPGAVGNRDVAGPEGFEVFDGLKERREASFGLRGEELERDRGFALAENLVNPHGKPPRCGISIRSSGWIVEFFHRPVKRVVGIMEALPRL
jgi:hypothetical protein